MAGYASGCRAVAIAFAVVVMLPIPLAAHDAHIVGPYRLELGWGEEPAFAGIRNTVVVEITEAAGGAAVNDLGGGSLTAEVSFGSGRILLPLRSDGERRNEYRASLVPTRAGSYTFHITGKVRSQAVDVTSTCSQTTFDCVTSLADIQFPARDPSPGELAERVDRSLPRADRALESARRAQQLAAAAIVVAAVSLAAAIGLGRRRSRDASK